MRVGIEPERILMAHTSEQFSAATGIPTSGEVLGPRALNRALLARQLLLQREKRLVLETIEHLVGMQAQVPGNPYVALWSRLDGFQPEELSHLIVERRAVRTTVMRTTIHLVSADDCLTLRPLMQSVMVRTLANTAWARNIEGVETASLIAAGQTLLEEQPHTRAELGTRLKERWPDRDAASLAWAVSYLVPVVQVPPRGLWGKSGQARLTTVESWLGRPLDADPSPDEMVLRYLAAFGPAGTADIRTWAGLAGVREIIERLRPRLVTFRDERGHELFDLPDAPRPDPETPAPPRFLPEYDNILLSHDDRGRIIRDNRGLPMPAGRGGELGSLLVDGFLGGMWRITRDRGKATLLIEAGSSWTKSEQRAVAEEGARLLTFMAADVQDHGVQFRTSDL
jgi:hypothetical protein